MTFGQVVIKRVIRFWGHRFKQSMKGNFIYTPNPPQDKYKKILGAILSAYTV